MPCCVGDTDGLAEGAYSLINPEHGLLGSLHSLSGMMLPGFKANAVVTDLTNMMNMVCFRKFLFYVETGTIQEIKPTQIHHKDRFCRKLDF